MGYWEAYAARLLRNQEQLIQLAKDVVEMDPSVEIYVHKDYGKRRITSVLFFKDETMNDVGFHEVPYRWSGCGYKEIGNGHPGIDNVGMPFIAEQVLNTMKPVTHEVEINTRKGSTKYFESKQKYLEKYSFYKLLTFKKNEDGTN